MSKDIIKKYFSELGKKSAKKQNRPPEYFKELAQKSVEARRKKKEELSTDDTQ